jgi:hypothetical protein
VNDQTRAVHQGLVESPAERDLSLVTGQVPQRGHTPAQGPLGVSQAMEDLLLPRRCERPGEKVGRTGPGVAHQVDVRVDQPGDDAQLGPEAVGGPLHFCQLVAVPLDQARAEVTVAVPQGYPFDAQEQLLYADDRTATR